MRETIGPAHRADTHFGAKREEGSVMNIQAAGFPKKKSLRKPKELAETKKGAGKLLHTVE